MDGCIEIPQNFYCRKVCHNTDDDVLPLSLAEVDTVKLAELRFYEIELYRRTPLAGRRAETNNFKIETEIFLLFVGEAGKHYCLKCPRFV
jgi:hypothetical protein